MRAASRVKSLSDDTRQNPSNRPAMKQVHRVDDQGDVGRILSRRIGELLLGDDGVLRQNISPALGPCIGEVAIDAANAGLPDLGNLLEQSVRDLCGRIVRIDQNSETGRAGFGRHDFPQSLNRGDIVPRSRAVVSDRWI
jgi:hypothetical protein